MAVTLSLLTIKDGALDAMTELAIATICASSVFKKFFPSFDPFELDSIQLPKLFHEFWEIQTRFDSQLIPKTLKEFQLDDSKHPVPEDQWIAFVRKMCKIGNYNFTKTLERARPIPLNVTNSISGMPAYIPGSSSKLNP